MNDHEAMLYRTIRDYAGARFRRLAEKVLWRMRRFSATGVFGNDHGFRTLWDEYAHFIQTGYEDTLIENAIREALPGYIDDLIAVLDDAEARLLTVAGVDEVETEAYCDDTAFRKAVIDRLSPMAGERDLRKFEIA